MVWVVRSQCDLHRFSGVNVMWVFRCTGVVVMCMGGLDSCDLGGL